LCKQILPISRPCVIVAAFVGPPGSASVWRSPIDFGKSIRPFSLTREISMKPYLGPSFQLVDTIEWADLARDNRCGPRTNPLLLKGAVRAWPAWQRWSFENL